MGLSLAAHILNIHSLEDTLCPCNLSLLLFTNDISVWWKHVWYQRLITTYLHIRMYHKKLCEHGNVENRFTAKNIGLKNNDYISHDNISSASSHLWVYNNPNDISRTTIKWFLLHFEHKLFKNIYCLTNTRCSLDVGFLVEIHSECKPIQALDS